MYTQLLKAVLAQEADPTDQSPSQGPLADVVWLRDRLEPHAARKEPGWALEALADQLAYDAALVQLARERGMAFGPDAFAIPARGRATLEQALIASGVSLQTRTERGAGAD